MQNLSGIQVAVLDLQTRMPSVIKRLSEIQKVEDFTHLKVFFYMACPKPGAQFEIVSWVRKNESDGDHNLNSDFEIPEKELKGRAFHV